MDEKSPSTGRATIRRLPKRGSYDKGDIEPTKAGTPVPDYLREYPSGRL